MLPFGSVLVRGEWTSVAGVELSCVLLLLVVVRFVVGSCSRFIPPPP